MTGSDSAEHAVRHAWLQFRTRLDEHLQVVDLSEGGEHRIGAAVDWLVAVQDPEGFWGYRSPAVTATCCVAIATWRPTRAEALLGRAADWLLDQAVDGRWETVWDSAAAVTAITLAGGLRNDRVQRAVDRLRSLDPGASAGRPHHCAQVLGAAAVLGWSAADKEPWVDCMTTDLDARSGCYVIGQAAFGLLLAGRPTSDVAEVLDHLAAYLTETPLSSAALLDHTAALRALAAAGTHTDVVDRSIDELFGSAFRRDGSWYHDPWYTAWALLALHEASSVRRVVVEQPRLNDYLAHAERSVVTVRRIELRRGHQEHRARRQVLLATLLIEAGLIGIATAVLLLPESNRLFSSGLALTSVLWVVTVGWQLLWPLLRRDAPADDRPGESRHT